MSFLSLLRQRLTIARPQAGPVNSWGEVTAALTLVAVDVPCAWREQGAEVTRAGAVVATADVELDLALGTDIRVDDVLDIDGRRHEVLAVNRVANHHLLVRAAGVR